MVSVSFPSNAPAQSSACLQNMCSPCAPRDQSALTTCILVRSPDLLGSRAGTGNAVTFIISHVTANPGTSLKAATYCICNLPNLDRLLFQEDPYKTGSHHLWHPLIPSL